ncbi:beta-ketoacyl synthase N-terminal-like domain-containing protein [Streptomyces sp. FIT100]
MSGRRVVVTGVGAKTAAGTDVQTIWKNVLDGIGTA